MLELLNQIPVESFWQKVIGVGAIVIVTCLAVLIAKIIITFITKHITSRTKTELDEKLAQAIKKYIYLFIYLIGLTLLADFLKSMIEIEFGKKIFIYVDGVIYALGVFLVSTILVKILTTIFTWYGDTIASKTETTVDDEFVPLIDRASKIIIYTLAVLIVLDHFHVDIKGLVTVLGVGSLAIALAAQETVANMIGGFVIMIDRPFRVGDWLWFEDKNRYAKVYQIGVRSTKFLTYENTLIIIPNAELMKQTIHNVTYPEPEIRIRLSVGVSYASDIELVKRILLEEAKKHPEVLETPEPIFRFTEFADSSLNVLLVCAVADVITQYHVSTELREIILTRFRENNIEIPFPQRVVHFQPNGVSKDRASGD